MQELIKYFEALEARIAALETQVSELQAKADEQESLKIAMENHLESMEEHCTELEGFVATLTNERNELLERLEESENQALPEPEPVVEPEPEHVAEPEPEVVVEPEPVVEPKKEPVIFDEEPVSPKAAIYGKAVSEIRQAISLGDRFLYQRELFGQNAELMQRTLSELNELSSFDEAIRYISRFNWDTESNTYQQFLVTLHRRFG